MKIKPLPNLHRRNSSVEIENISSLPSLTLDSLTLHMAPMNEHRESIEIEGRLLMLSILNLENKLKRNKRIHDRNSHVNGKSIWPICDCTFAERIRLEDMGFFRRSQ